MVAFGFGFTWQSMSAVTMLTLPDLDAMCSGVSPHSSALLTVAGETEPNRCAAAVCWCSTAQYKGV